MLSKTAKWAITQILISEIIDELEGIFKNINVDFMLIKGAYLIAKGLGDKMPDRKITDIDILVNTKDLKEVSDYLISLPQCELITYYLDNSRQTETILKYQLRDFSITLEIMDRVNSEDRFLLSSKDLFCRAENIRGNLFSPSREDALLIMICHLHSHIYFEFRSTNFEEMKILSDVNNFDWDKFWELAQKTGMVSFNYFILSFYNRETNSYVKLPKKYLYADLLLRYFTLEKYFKMPTLMRRLILDLPFARRPIMLMFRKILG